MREAVSLASLFLLLALAGMEPSHAQAVKTCKAGAVAEILSSIC